jgi:hypothetical protein
MWSLPAAGFFPFIKGAPMLLVRAEKVSTRLCAILRETGRADAAQRYEKWLAFDYPHVYAIGAATPASCLLEQSFLWSATPEGGNYWKKVRDQVQQWEEAHNIEEPSDDHTRYL